MTQNLSFLLVSIHPGEALLVEEALHPGFTHLQIQQAADVHSWQQALEAGGFELALIAETLPWAETSTLVQDLKRRHPECPVILLASPAGEVAAWEALGRGVDDYVLATPEELRRLPKVIQAAKHRVRPLAGEICGMKATELLGLVDQRKEAEEKLRHSELLYRSIFENTGTATCISDENTILLLVNDECTKITGYSREELEGKKSWTEFIVPEDLERLKEYHRLRPIAPGAAPRSYTLRWQDRQGGIRDMLVSIALIPGTKNTVASLLDITALQQAQKALRESEERYRLLVENLNDGLGMQDANGAIIFVNQRFCQMLGYSREELLGRPVGDFLDAANQEILQKQRKRRQKGERRSYELTWTRKDGAPVITTISPVPMFDAAGKYNGSFAVVADITARRQAEKALRESEEKYRAIFENTGTPMAIVNADNTLSLVNEEFAKLSGFSREEIEGKKIWMEFAAAEDIPKMEEYHRLRRIDPLQAPRNYEACFIDRHGERKDMLMTASMIPGTTQSVGSLLDFTARKRAEQELDHERKKFEILAENLPFALVLIDKDGAFKYINPRFIELFGYNLADVPDGRTWFRKAYQDPAYRRQGISAWISDLERAKPGEKRPRTFKVTCKDGMEKIISFIPLQLENGDNLMTCEDITEQHLAVEMMKQSEQRFRLLMENSMSHLTIIDGNGTILYETPAIERTLGYEIGELMGRNSMELIHPEDLVRSQEIMMNLLQSPGLVFSTVVRYRHKDGSWRFLEVKAKNLLNEPIIRGIVVNAHDITQRTEALEALRQSEAEKSLILKNIEDKVVYYDRNNRILWANRAMTDFVRMTSEEMMGRFCYEVMHQRQSPCPDCPVIRAMEAGQPLELERVKPDGRILFYRSTPVKDEDGKVQGNVLLVRDITASKKAEEALKASEEKMRMVIESSPVGIRITQDGRHIYGNPALLNMFGYAHSWEIVGQPVDLLVAREERQIPQPEQPANHPGKPAPYSYEAKCYKKDGSSFEVQVWQTEIEYQGAPAILDFVLDISEAKALRGQLLQAQKMEAMGTLAGGIAHDFNNILFPILVNTEMTLETLAPESPLKRRMERVFQACERAIDLVKQILSFSRREERELSPVRLTPIIDDTLKFLRASLPATIEMHKHLENDADTVLADPTQIQQVLINLYTNAAFALRDRGGVIDISLQQVDSDKARGVLPPDLGPGSYLQLTVTDNGQGMEHATIERILDPYFTTKKPGEGTGLGLAVVHGIIKRHGGAIAVESALGKGSSFHIFLPRAEEEALKKTRAPIPLLHGQERILLVDDEPDIVTALKQMLEGLGYRVSAFTGSEAALQSFKLRPGDFDLVITDQTMPHLTGEELAREMLSLRPDLPIILCTGFSEAVSPEKVRDLGIKEFILKPIATRVMAETIRRALAP